MKTLTTDLGVEGLPDPLHGVLLGNTVGWSETATLGLLLRHVESRTLEDDVEVHTVDTGGRVVLETKIDMLVDTESEVSWGINRTNISSRRGWIAGRGAQSVAGQGSSGD